MIQGVFVRAEQQWRRSGDNARCPETLTTASWRGRLEFVRGKYEIRKGFHKFVNSQQIRQFSISTSFCLREKHVGFAVYRCKEKPVLPVIADFRLHLNRFICWQVLTHPSTSVDLPCRIF
ncbi:hypothetical protein CDAR_560361 [Caerostris darwini]|uniref:Uncharacterized protein n=1 Tax=Caerostris darwini TaxID=1538125 RepID=A0AAV4VYW7_9ARAC|nr:hypothetical protein CDAR_560101 [Caerostris darwini]GIY75670.1 hypothetical protein CDAR_560361 [Caerostris darwini]